MKNLSNEKEVFHLLTLPESEGGLGIERERLDRFEGNWNLILFNIVENLEFGGPTYAKQELISLFAFEKETMELKVTCSSIVLWVRKQLLLTRNEQPKQSCLIEEIPKPPEFMTISKFKDLLSRYGIERFLDGVLDRILSNYIHRFMAVDSPSSAFQLYDFVKCLPSTKTKELLEKYHGIRLNGSCDPSFCFNIITGADRFGAPVLVKILLGEKQDNDREIQVIEYLGLDSPPEGIVEIKLCAVSFEGEGNTNRFSDGMNHFLIMPHYSRSLAQLEKVLTEEVILREGTKIYGALEFIHSKGMVHMDVKPSNIFVSTEGEWFLGDFGSCVKIGERIVSCSESFLPYEVINQEAKIGYDFFMLAVSLLVILVDQKQIMKEQLTFVDVNKMIDTLSTIEFTDLKLLIQTLITKANLNLSTNKTESQFDSQ